MNIAIVTEITLVGHASGIESVKTTAFDTVPKAFEFMMDAYMEKMSNGDVFNDEHDDNHVLVITNDDTLYSAYLNVVEVQSGEVCASTIATNDETTGKGQSKRFDTDKDSRCNMEKRTDTEILKDLVEVVRTHNALRDDEWDFEESHGDRHMWNAEDMAAHDKLLDEIRESTEKVRILMVEATGDETITF